MLPGLLPLPSGTRGWAERVLAETAPLAFDRATSIRRPLVFGDLLQLFVAGAGVHPFRQIFPPPPVLGLHPFDAHRVISTETTNPCRQHGVERHPPQMRNVHQHVEVRNVAVFIPPRGWFLHPDVADWNATPLKPMTHTLDQLLDTFRNAGRHIRGCCPVHRDMRVQRASDSRRVIECIKQVSSLLRC